MKQIIIKALDQHHAMEIAKKDYNINVQYNGTKLWKKQGSPLEGFAFVRVCLNILDAYTDRQVNSGIIISLDEYTQVKHKFERGFEVDPCIQVRGRLRQQLKRVTEVIDAETNEVVGEYVYKNEALKAAKKHAAKTGHQTNGVAKFVVKDPSTAIIFKVKFTEKQIGKLRRYLIVVLDQMADVKAKGVWHGSTNK